MNRRPILSRRNFSLTILAAAICLPLSVTIRRLLQSPEMSTKRPGYDIGPRNQFSEGRTPLPLERIAIIREVKSVGTENFAAISLVCTHQTCLLKSEQGQSQLLCPCHGSKFSSTGEVLNGPAKTPLPWYRLSTTKSGNLLVHREERVSSTWRLSIPSVRS